MRFRLVVALSALALASGCGEDTLRDINFGKEVGWDYTLPDGTVPTDGGDAREGGTEVASQDGNGNGNGMTGTDATGGTTKDAVSDMAVDMAAPADATGGNADAAPPVDMAAVPDAGADATDDLASAG
jgi:hypothetical protein